MKYSIHTPKQEQFIKAYFSGIRTSDLEDAKNTLMEYSCRETTCKVEAIVRMDNEYFVKFCSETNAYYEWLNKDWGGNFSDDPRLEGMSFYNPTEEQLKIWRETNYTHVAIALNVETGMWLAIDTQRREYASYIGLNYAPSKEQNLIFLKNNCLFS